MSKDSTFYLDLPVHQLSLQELLRQEEKFIDAPEGWHVIVADVQDSTIAVGEGRHHDVNLAATGAIIALLNRLRSWGEEGSVAYFFGGDGATFLVPDARHAELFRTLDVYRHHVFRTSGLLLRVGSLPVAAVTAAGDHIRVAKCKLNDRLTVPVALGNGLKRAESRIKAEFLAASEDGEESVDLNGMECRWEEVLPPRDEEQILVLIVNCPDEGQQAKIYSEVLTKIEDVFGQLNQRRPITATRLKLNLTIGAVRREMRGRLGRFDLRYLIRAWLANLYGPRWFKTSPIGREYRNQVSELSDTIMIDGTINTVISGNKQQTTTLLAYLNDLESRGLIIYGAHGTHASVISCYVLDHDENHLHFIDGTEGGYTAAAKVYKAKLKRRAEKR